MYIFYSTVVLMANDKSRIQELLQNPHYKVLDPLAAEVINVCTNAGLSLQDNDKEDINMCKAIDEMREESRLEGIEIGQDRRSKEMAIALLKENVFTSNKISELTKLSLNEVQQLKEQITAHS